LPQEVCWFYSILWQYVFSYKDGQFIEYFSLCLL
jgi:hypothetical protein